MKNFFRELGNKVVTEVSKYFKENISDEYVLVRYMGPKFVIVFSGVEVNGVAEFLNDKKETIESFNIKLKDDLDELQNEDTKPKRRKKKEPEIVHPRLNFAISSYYKGTGLEEVLKKLETYLDSADITESDINNI